MTSDTKLRRMYLRLNRRYFSLELPEDTIILWEPCNDAEANTCPVWEVAHGKFKIAVDPAIMGFPKWVEERVLHEMAHIRLWAKHPKHQHGQLFQQEMLRLATAGALRYLW